MTTTQPTPVLRFWLTVGRHRYQVDPTAMVEALRELTDPVGYKHATIEVLHTETNEQLRITLDLPKTPRMGKGDFLDLVVFVTQTAAQAATNMAPVEKRWALHTFAHKLAAAAAA